MDRRGHGGTFYMLIDRTLGRVGFRAAHGGTSYTDVDVTSVDSGLWQEWTIISDGLQVLRVSRLVPVSVPECRRACA